MAGGQMAQRREGQGKADPWHKGEGMGQRGHKIEKVKRWKKIEEK